MLGPFEAWGDGTPLSLGPPARRAVLGLLLIDPGVRVRRDAIIDVLARAAAARAAGDDETAVECYEHAVGSCPLRDRLASFSDWWPPASGKIHQPCAHGRPSIFVDRPRPGAHPLRAGKALV